MLSKFDLDKDGKFSLELHLVAGVNTVKVTATQSGATLDDTIEINYTTVADNTPIIVLVVAIGMLLLTFAIEEVRFGVIRHKLSSSQKVV